MSLLRGVSSNFLSPICHLQGMPGGRRRGRDSNMTHATQGHQDGDLPSVSSILKDIQHDLASLKVDTACIKTDFANVKEGILKDIQHDLASLKVDTACIKTDLANVKEGQAFWGLLPTLVAFLSIGKDTWIIDSFRKK